MKYVLWISLGCLLALAGLGGCQSSGGCSGGSCRASSYDSRGYQGSSGFGSGYSSTPAYQGSGSR